MKGYWHSSFFLVIGHLSRFSFGSVLSADSEKKWVALCLKREAQLRDDNSTSNMVFIPLSTVTRYNTRSVSCGTAEHVDPGKKKKKKISQPPETIGCAGHHYCFRSTFFSAKRGYCWGGGQVFPRTRNLTMFFLQKRSIYRQTHKCVALFIMIRNQEMLTVRVRQIPLPRRVGTIHHFYS